MTTNFPTAKDCIIEAFLQLCLTIPCDQITVSQLTKKAGYNRSTSTPILKIPMIYYAIWKLSFLIHLGSSCLSHSALSSQATLLLRKDGFSNSFFKTISVPFLFCWAKMGDPRFAHKIKRSLRQAILQYLNLTEAQLTPQTDMLLEFIISGHLQVLVYCGERPDSLSPLDFWLRMSNSIDREKFLAAMTSKPDKSF